MNDPAYFQRLGSLRLLSYSTNFAALVSWGFPLSCKVKTAEKIKDPAWEKCVSVKHS